MPNGYGLYGMTSIYKVWCWDMIFYYSSIRNVVYVDAAKYQSEVVPIEEHLAYVTEPWITFRIVCTAKQDSI